MTATTGAGSAAVATPAGDDPAAMAALTSGWRPGEHPQATSTVISLRFA
ncbi:hypothetical protein [Streptomyces sp. NPDC003077]